MIKEDIETFYPASRQAWREWLQENHRSKQSIWLICYKIKSGRPTISWSEAVDEALCFGWIDSTRKSVDHETFIQFFCKRKPKSIWSKINKGKVQQLTDEGLMTQAGFDSVEIAKQNGSWTISDDVEELIIPQDLELELDNRPGAKDFFLSLSKSVRKIMLHRLVMAKQPATRQKRINEIVEQAAQKRKPKQF